MEHPTIQHLCYPDDFSQNKVGIIHAHLLKIQGLSYEEFEKNEWRNDSFHLG